MNKSVPSRAAALSRAHEAAFGPGPLRLARAPGRVNLIGEHTDYHLGFVLPLALECDTWIVFRPGSGRQARFRSLDMGETVDMDLDQSPSTLRGHWSRYVHGMAATLRDAGHDLAGLEAVVQGTVPMGAGLASSASLVVAAALAFLDVAGFDLDPDALITAARRTEHNHVGVRSGIMDFAVAIHGRGGPVLIDCADASVRPVAPVPEDTTLMVTQSGIQHALAASAYNDRVQECGAALEVLRRFQDSDLRALRDVDRALLQKARPDLDPVHYRRVRHVVEENRRVLEAVEALEAGDAPRLGTLMRASYESLRDDYAVSCAEIDTLVALAHSVPGVHGSRITGGGFGGATVTLLERNAVARFQEAVGAGYLEAHGREAAFMEAVAGEAASVGALSSSSR